MEHRAAEPEALWHLAHDETQVAAGGPSGLQAEALVLARQGDFPAAVEYACQGQALAEQVASLAYGAWNRWTVGQASATLGQTRCSPP